MHSVTLAGLDFRFADGTVVFDDVSVSLSGHHVGVVGANGAGKTTLVRLLTGDLVPSGGTITRPGSVALVSQDITLRSGVAIDSLIGVAHIRAATRRIEDGTASASDHELLEGNWDIDDRAVALFGHLGLDHLVSVPSDLDRVVDHLSGGEATLVAVIGAMIAEPDLVVLDEPTNNLDPVARDLLVEAIARSSAQVVTVSHDRDLLDTVDQIAEVRDGGIRVVTGDHTHFEEIVAAEQQRAREVLATARNDEARQRRDLVESQTVIAHRKRYGRKMSAQKREPKIVMQQRRRSAQESAAKLTEGHRRRLDEAHAAATSAADDVRDDRAVRIDLPETAVHPGQVVLAQRRFTIPRGPVDVAVDLEVVGPERIHLRGRNGAGKTTLLRQVLAAPPEVATGVVHQAQSGLDPEASPYDLVSAVSPDRSAEQRRAGLARLLFRGREADRPMRELSGGERVRAALAVALLTSPAPHLLVLDEPTNNVDIATRDHLAQALAGFRGAVIVVSHDTRFVADLGITRVVDLDDR
ncbi:ATP-binding cassette domain-containing protein [Williamsia deligens]|uniref:ATP-binding cassette domain-containing protein n=1 Tax=Williamsia deligens TaxID=321325 RepID=A0ABW3G3Y9_9NOCA|nr:ATP-binding cassette domain-containing protein [Williamsia deligens]MCP2194037.1 ATPase components of ABC transporters with duplicated ATPase domains [Williamsia deligens]